MSANRRHAPVALACLLVSLAAGSRAQIVTTPNQIVGEARWLVSNPDILAVVNRPTDVPPGAGEGLSILFTGATSLPPQSPELRHSTSGRDGRGTWSPYEITVEAGPPGAGIAYSLDFSAYTSSKHYQFRGSPGSAPVEAEPAPDVHLDVAECVTLVQIDWFDEDGFPVSIGRGYVWANWEETPGSSSRSTRAHGGLNAGDGRDYLVIPSDVGRYQLVIEYTLGGDPYVDSLTFRTERWITAPCDEIVHVEILVDHDSGSGIPLPQIRGRFDVLRENEWRIETSRARQTRMWAIDGPWGNERFAWIDRDPSCGEFTLINLADSRWTSPETGYRVGGATVFRSGRSFERFITPQLGVAGDPVVVHAPEIVDLGDTFVIDPGYVRGDIVLRGPPADSVPGGPCLDDIALLDPALDYDEDAAWLMSTSYGLEISCVGASGASGFGPGAPRSAVGGRAEVAFDGRYDGVVGSFDGAYELVLGGLNREESLWMPSQLQLKIRGFDMSGDRAAYHVSRVSIYDQNIGSMLIEPSAVLDLPRHYCFSEVRLSFLASAGQFRSPALSAGGRFVGTDFEGRPADQVLYVGADGRPTYDEPPGTEGLVALALPQGTYTITPFVSELNPGGGYSSNQLPPFDIVVGCRQVVEMSTQLQLLLENLPICSTDRILHVSGTVQGGADVARIAWTLNGGAEQVACLACGVDPSYAFDVTLADCDDEIVVTAEDGAGNVARVTAFTRHAGGPVTVTGCADVAVEAARGETSAPATWPLPTASDGCGGSVDVTCDHASGDRFPIGDTTVTCTGKDACDNRGECRFVVSVRPWVPPLPIADAGPDRTACVSRDVLIGGAPTGSSGVPPYRYAWTPATGLDDASSANPVATVTGPVTYTVTVTDAFGQVATDSCTVGVEPATPTAACGAPAGPFCEDQPVCFTNGSTGGVAYEWDFGTPTGDASSDEAPCFAFPAPGSFTVTLTAVGRCGRDEASVVVLILPKPVADFTFDTQGCVGDAFDFTDRSTQSPTSWQWDFGDGTTSVEQDPSHVYLRDGIHVVRLVACNSCGCSDPHYEAIEIAASCNTNCEANSNQVACGGASSFVTGDTSVDHDNFNTTSYACAPGIFYSGENKIHDLNFGAGSNFILRLVETIPEPNGYDLDLMVSTACNPPECAAWGDELVVFDDRTARNDDYWVIVDGREGTSGPFRLEVQCLDPASTTSCRAPSFDGVVSARDEDPCGVSGVVVEWAAAADWGADAAGVACSSGRYEVWRAPLSDPLAERNVASGLTGTSFVDRAAVPGRTYVYRVLAANDCCGEPALTVATATAMDGFADPLDVDAGAARVLACGATSVRLLAHASGGTGDGFDVAWTPSAPLSDASVLSPSCTEPGTYTLTVVDLGSGCTTTDTVEVTREDGAAPEEPSALDLRPAAAPLLVAWTDVSRARLRLTWEATGSDDFRVLQGSIPALHATGYDHAALLCGLLSPSRALTPDAGSLYFVVAAANCWNDLSSTGRSSLGAERPAPTACP